MSIGELNFTRDWTDPTDFPVVTNREREARENLQCLHNETRDYLNRVVRPALNTAADRIIPDDKKPEVRYRLGAADGELYYEEVPE